MPVSGPGLTEGFAAGGGFFPGDRPPPGPVWGSLTDRPGGSATSAWYALPPASASASGSGADATPVVLAAGLAGSVWAGWSWSQGQYYVGAAETDDGRQVVAVYRGLPQDVGPIRLSTVDELTDVAVEDLPTFQQGIVDEGIRAADRTAARRIVSQLRDQLETG